MSTTTANFNSFSSSNSTQNNASASADSVILQVTYLDYVVLSLTVIVLILGLVSWILIKKFRHFKNYVLLNTIIASITSYVVVILNETKIFEDLKLSVYMPLHWYIIIYDGIMTYFRLVMHCWLVVLCWVFYVDIVKVFSADVSRRYLKSSLFAWGLPVIGSLIDIAPTIVFYLTYKYFKQETNAIIIKAAFAFDIIVMIIPLLINLFVSIRVFVALFKTSTVSRTAVNSRRIYIAILIFLLSGIIFLSLPLLVIFNVPDIVNATVEYMQTMAMNIYFVVGKSNRNIWRDFYVKRLKPTSPHVGSSQK